MHFSPAMSQRCHRRKGSAWKGACEYLTIDLIGGAEGDRTPDLRIANGKTGSLQFLTGSYMQ
jgi:hypothetical protein